VLSWVSAVGSRIEQGPESLNMPLNIHLPLQFVFTETVNLHYNFISTISTLD